MEKSALPPMGVYVPAVVWFNENDKFDEPAIKAHVLRLAQVCRLARVKGCSCTDRDVGWRDRYTRPGQQR